MYRNLMITMILGGLWHGAAWNFVLWGFYQGALLVLHRVSEPWLDKILPEGSSFSRSASFAIRVICMFHLTCYGWLLFRATSFHQIATMTRSLFAGPWTYDPALATDVALFATPLILIQCLQYFSGQLNFLRFRWMAPEFRVAAYSALAYFVIFKAAKPQSFIYFQF